jgi:hypothetical protein
MNKTRCGVVGLGLIAVAHYVVSPCVPGHGDSPDAPPLASFSVMASTATVAFDGISITVDPITDAEHSAPAVDRRHPAMVVPALPPTVAASSVGAICPGVVTFKSTT